MCDGKMMIKTTYAKSVLIKQIISEFKFQSDDILRSDI